jgi:hypothetical protein
MEWQAQNTGGLLRGWKQQTIAPEIIESHSPQADTIHQRTQPRSRNQLKRQKMVALQAGIVARLAVTIDRTKRYSASTAVRIQPVGLPPLVMRSSAPFALNSQLSPTPPGPSIRPEGYGPFSTKS